MGNRPQLTPVTAEFAMVWKDDFSAGQYGTLEFAVTVVSRTRLFSSAMCGVSTN